MDFFPVDTSSPVVYTPAPCAHILSTFRIFAIAFISAFLSPIQMLRFVCFLWSLSRSY
jgi:hypothetical protein